MKPLIYLDSAATTKPDQAALEKTTKLICEHFDNPSSTHSGGEAARTLLEQARKSISNSLGCTPKEVCFTSGGTEANAIALNGPAELGEFVLSTIAEHPSVADHSVDKVGINKDGSYDLNRFEEQMKRMQRWKARKTLAVSLVNTETGRICITDNSLWDLCQKYQVGLHIDASAAYLKVPFELKCDTMTVSAHKVHGLKGTGVLYVREGCERYRMFAGGSQENGLRPGTENILGAVHFGMVVGNGEPHLDQGLQKKFEDLLADTSTVNGGESRVWSVSNLFFPKVKDVDLFLHLLDEAGVLASGKSACKSGMPEPSKVLEAMYGVGAAETKGSARFSFSKLTTMDEVEQAASIVRKVVQELE